MGGWVAGLVVEAGNKTNSALLSWGLAELGNYFSQPTLREASKKLLQNFETPPPRAVWTLNIFMVRPTSPYQSLDIQTEKV